MIKTITLKFGRAENLAAQSIDTLPITVFVGPNNSGKSQILTEIQQFCRNGKASPANHLVESIVLSDLAECDAERIIDSLTIKPKNNEFLENNSIYFGKFGERITIDKTALKEALLLPNKHQSGFCSWYLRFKTVILNGNNRINLVNEQNGGDLLEEPKTSFQLLFRDNEKRETVRRIVYDAFKQYFVIDPTKSGKLRIRLSENAPESNTKEQSLDSEAVTFYANALDISQASDGVKAFTGMIIEMVAGDPSVLLIDEPEAFLHPALSFKLGKEISTLVSQSNKRLFVSTHSSNFVMGCIQSGTPVHVVRLTYQRGIPTARILPNDSILKLMRNPLLRSVGVLNALFYEFVVVTEADADRAFYQEINDRLLKHSTGRGIPNCLFLNAQNKQTVKTIVKPLRELGIPVAAIVDIDVLKDGGSHWTALLECVAIPELEMPGLANTRHAIDKKFSESGKDMKRDGGIKILGEEDQEALKNLLERLTEYGLFVVSKGELESWLKHLGALGHGPNWLVAMFERMGEDPSSPDFLLPDDGDVWEFIDCVAAWFSNPRRKGIPN